ncbi:MAG: hypothetical protein VZQ61_02080 [Christensenellaceae bacterium]
MREFIKRLYKTPLMRLDYFEKADAIVMSGYEELVDDIDWDEAGL